MRKKRERERIEITSKIDYISSSSSYEHNYYFLLLKWAWKEHARARSRVVVVEGKNAANINKQFRYNQEINLLLLLLLLFSTTWIVLFHKRLESTAGGLPILKTLILNFIAQQINFNLQDKIKFCNLLSLYSIRYHIMPFMSTEMRSKWQLVCCKNIIYHSHVWHVEFHFCIFIAVYTSTTTSKKIMHNFSRVNRSSIKIISMATKLTQLKLKCPITNN